MVAAIDDRTTDLIRSALERSGMSLRQFAAELGTSPARMSAYANGRTVPSVALALRMLDLAGVEVGLRPGRLGANATVGAIDADYVASPSDALRWMLQGRDHLLEMSALEADLKWGSPGRLPRDERWSVLFRAVIAAAYRDRGARAPAWTKHGALDRPWQPLPRLPIRSVAELDTALSRLNIRIRAKDLTSR